jgi:hypothetical protein
MPHINQWLLAASVATLLFVEWWLVRTIYHRRLAASLTRRQLEQQAAAKLLAQTRQQIKQLQQEVAVLRPLAVRAARHTARPGAHIAAADATLSQRFDNAASARPALPVDGFADTLPSLQFTHQSL